jgi:hypothetical protein
MEFAQLEATKAAWGDERAKELAQEEGENCSIVLQVRQSVACFPQHSSSTLLCLRTFSWPAVHPDPHMIHYATQSSSA